MKNKNKLKVRFLGGVGEIGKNITVLEYGKDIIVIDCGLTFPSIDMPGIDLVIPDVSYLVQNKERVRGIFLTHGHEDHIGALPYVLDELKVPVYGTKLTLSLVETKIKEKGVASCKLKQVVPGQKVNAGCFNVEFINVNHSICGSCALAITTPVGIVVHSGDFKIDLTPIHGEIMDITRFSELGKKGVLLMMCESTNVERPGYAMSEHVVGDTLARLFDEYAKKRIIIATFSSNVHRIQQIMNIAKSHKRKVALLGRSMLNVCEAAMKINELKIDPSILVDIENSKNIPDKELVVICTGSQGEPMSALTRMANDDFKQLKLTKNDTIIISATPIPGNERSIYQVINNLYKKGAEVVYQSLEKIHVSGHACQEELKIFHSLIKPKFFIPVHGEYRHLVRHANLAKEMGLKDNQIMICENGDTVEFNERSMRRAEKIATGAKFVDGLYIDDDESVVKDRIHLAEDGVIIAVVCLSQASGQLLSDPDIITKGIKLSDDQLADLKYIVEKSLKELDAKSAETVEIRQALRRCIRKYIIRKTQNSPMILPIITIV